MVKFHKKIVRLHPTINKRMIKHLTITIWYGLNTSHEDGPNRDQSILTQQYTQQTYLYKNHSIQLLIYHFHKYPHTLITNIITSIHTYRPDLTILETDERSIPAALSAHTIYQESLR
jgi:hypothetical protein